VIDDTGHAPHLERSDAFLDALQAGRDAADRS
jgi:pimeloyl-ACP methyl ester carboxylesterase